MNYTPVFCELGIPQLTPPFQLTNYKGLLALYHCIALKAVTFISLLIYCYTYVGDVITAANEKLADEIYHDRHVARDVLHGITVHLQTLFGQFCIGILTPLILFKEILRMC